jgi:hypothetical protein
MPQKKEKPNLRAGKGGAKPETPTKPVRYAGLDFLLLAAIADTQRRAA